MLEEAVFTLKPEPEPRVSMAHDRGVENWLHEQVGPACDALKADPSRAITVAGVRARLAAEHAKAR